LDACQNFDMVKTILMQLNYFGCKFVEIRVRSIDIHTICQILNEEIFKCFYWINLKISLIEEIDHKQISQLFNEILKKLTVDINTVYSLELYGMQAYYNFQYKNIEIKGINKTHLDHKCCGLIRKAFFSLNIENIRESLHHNSCLNRKISIDAEGNIKNCPSMKESFGNIKDTTLAEAIEKPGFKKYWDINKDKIHVCKDCEFRYICTDCRAYVEDPEDILSKPLKCGYNPYTGEWAEWSTNPLKQKAIDFYGMREIL
jgi:SPASM domain peptide maturase of grasp-with-spasm system